MQTIFGEVNQTSHTTRVLSCTSAFLDYVKKKRECFIHKKKGRSLCRRLLVLFKITEKRHEYKSRNGKNF